MASNPHYSEEEEGYIDDDLSQDGIDGAPELSPEGKLDLLTWAQSRGAVVDLRCSSLWALYRTRSCSPAKRSSRSDRKGERSAASTSARSRQKGALLNEVDLNSLQTPMLSPRAASCCCF